MLSQLQDPLLQTIMPHVQIPAPLAPLLPPSLPAVPFQLGLAHAMRSCIKSSSVFRS